MPNFNPRPPHGGRRRFGHLCASGVVFQPAPPARRATCCSNSGSWRPTISTRAPRTEGDLLSPFLAATADIFQPAPPARRATPDLSANGRQATISTRAPRTEGDSPVRAGRREQDISTRAPRTEGDLHLNGSLPDYCGFQPAPPARRATVTDPNGDTLPIISTRAPRTEGDTSWTCTCPHPWNFNPRPPHGGRPEEAEEAEADEPISTRAPRTEGDTWDGENHDVLEVFQPAPPARRATVGRDAAAPARRHFNPRPPHGGRHGQRHSAHGGPAISTRAPRTEGDRQVQCRQRHFGLYFNPRPPHGGRPHDDGETSHEVAISTRAPRTEGDLTTMAKPVMKSPFQPAPPARRATGLSRTCQPLCTNFNPRPPHGGRPESGSVPTSTNPFQPAPPARRATGRTARFRPRPRHFNPRPPHGGRPASGRESSGLCEFQPAPPARRATRGPCGLAAQPGISTRAPRTEGDIVGHPHRVRIVISTRAPRTEGDR